MKIKSQVIDEMFSLGCCSCLEDAKFQCPFCDTKFCSSCWQEHKTIHKELKS